MPVLVALAVIAILSVASAKIRCYVCFNLVVIGFSAMVAGYFRPEEMFLYGGGVMLLVGVGILYVSSLRVEKSQRLYHMGLMLLSGLFSFLRLFAIMLIITIPFAGFCKLMASDFRERVIVNESGSPIGKAYVNEDLRDPEGNKYDIHNPF